MMKLIRNNWTMAMLWGWFACALGFEIAPWVGNTLLIVGFLVFLLTGETERV